MAIHISPPSSSLDRRKGTIIKTRLLTLWIVRNPQYREDWKEVSKGKKVSYDAVSPSEQSGATTRSDENSIEQYKMSGSQAISQLLQEQ